MTDDNMTVFHRIYEQWIEEGEQTPMPIQGVLNILSHWTFQSIVRMDNSERTFKALCTMVFTALFYRSGKKLRTAFFFGHSLNFLLNSHLAATLKTFNYSYYDDYDKFEAYATTLLDQLSGYDWVDHVYVTGSVNRDEWKPTSDLDVDVVRKPGIKNGIVAVVCGMVTRFSSTLHLFPIDLYIWDSREILNNRRIKDEEELVPYSSLDGLDDFSDQ